ncbi:Glycine dehydrogenase [Bienertia sinuspersici]
MKQLTEIRFRITRFTALFLYQISMVYQNTSIPVSKSIDQSTTMTVSMSLTDPYMKSKQINQFQKNRKIPNSSNNNNHHPNAVNLVWLFLI